jgi:hypothetical protein
VRKRSADASQYLRTIYSRSAEDRGPLMKFGAEDRSFDVKSQLSL